LKNLPSTLSAEARQMAEEAAGKVPRYKRKFEATKYVRTDRPAVANFVAGAIVKNLMDVERAVDEIKPDLSPVQKAQTAHELENDPNIQAAVQTELQRLGLDAESKEQYIQLLWRYAASEAPEHEKRQLTSLRLLGKAFLPEQVQIEKPETLPLRGLDEGLKLLPLALHCGQQRVILSHDLKPFSLVGNGPSPRRQDERQYNQPGQQHARENRERRLQWMRLKMSASLC
jgi:hypothetical protein